MAESEIKVQFRPENGNVDFEPDSQDRSGWRPFAGESFSWNKAAIGVGAAAAVAGAAYAASRYMGRGSDEGENSDSRRAESASA